MLMNTKILQKLAYRQYFTPNLFGQEILSTDHELFALPTRLGGINIQDSSKTAGALFYYIKFMYWNIDVHNNS